MEYASMTPLSPNHRRSSAERVFAFSEAGSVAAMSGKVLRRVRSSAVLAQGGTSSQASSPMTSPRGVVGSYDLETLPASWDNSPEIRERMRNGQNLVLALDHREGKLVSEYVDPTVDNLKANVEVLRPIMTVMKQNDLQLPSIEKLIGAVDGLFSLAKISRSDDHFYQEAWAIRRLISKLKRFTYRPTRPQEIKVKTCMC